MYLASVITFSVFAALLCFGVRVFGVTTANGWEHLDCLETENTLSLVKKKTKRGKEKIIWYLCATVFVVALEVVSLIINVISKK